nr:MAG TPA: hypothetical protein [Caudoviricetes sp.]
MNYFYYFIQPTSPSDRKIVLQHNSDDFTNVVFDKKSIRFV